MKISDAAGARKQEGESDAPLPGGCEPLFDDAQPFIGMDETVRCGQDPDMLGDGARRSSAPTHPEQDQRAGAGLCGSDFWHHLARAFCQNFSWAGFAPIPAIGWDRERLVAYHLAPNPAREAKTIAADPAQAGLIVIGRAEPASRCGNDQGRIGHG